MKTENKKILTVTAKVNSSVEKVWDYWTQPLHITRWNAASGDWHTPRAENDLRAGGKFLSRMEARDGSFGFDFGGVYDAVTIHKYIEYTLDDGRKVTIAFEPVGRETKITETFEPEKTHSLELQQTGWQAILDNFRKYAETN
jgi:uncharacterized protein YndB with AHSA1/START domain